MSHYSVEGLKIKVMDLWLIGASSLIPGLTLPNGGTAAERCRSRIQIMPDGHTYGFPTFGLGLRVSKALRELELSNKSVNSRAFRFVPEPETARLALPLARLYAPVPEIFAATFGAKNLQWFPKFKPWAIHTTLMFDSNMFSVDTWVQALMHVGERVGLGGFSPLAGLGSGSNGLFRVADPAEFNRIKKEFGKYATRTTDLLPKNWGYDSGLAETLIPIAIEQKKTA